MRDVGTAVRKAIFEALNGKIKWEGAAIPIVDEKLDRLISESDLYILFDSQNEQQQNVKTYFVTVVNLNIRIVNRRQSTSTKTIIENMSNQIVQILRPTKTTIGITIPAPFKLSLFNVTEGQYVFEKLDSGGFHDWKLLTTTTRITHE